MTWTSSGWRPSVAPAEVEAAGDADFAAHPELVRGLHRPAVDGPERRRAGGCRADRRAVPARPPGRGRHALDHRGRRARQARVRPRRRTGLHRRRHGRGGRGPGGRPGTGRLGSAGARPRHRDRPHLRARAQVRPGARPDGAGPERQGAGGDDGLLRHRRHPGARRARGGEQRRARAGLAGARGSGARARRRHRQGPCGVRGRRRARHRAVVARRRGPLRRPPRQGRRPA